NMKVGKRRAMPLHRKVLLILTLTLTTGCGLFRPEPLDWSIGVVAPKHYDVWVDYLFLETTGIRAWRVPMGWVSCCWKEPWSSSSSGGTPPPNYVVIRWFSYAERKFYGRQIRLPDDLEQRMRRKTLTYGNTVNRYDPQDSLILGLAPGGQIVVWIMNQAHNAEEIMRVQAFELEGNPEHYQVRLRNYEQEHGDYLRQHGIQYEGWYTASNATSPKSTLDSDANPDQRLRPVPARAPDR